MAAAKGRGLFLRVGVLIVAGAALALGLVLFLTANRLGRDSPVYETYLRESVQGLAVGGTVSYRGVAVGRITEITLASAVYRRPDASRFESAFQLVLVRFAIDTERLGPQPADPRRAVEAGLRVRLASQGITGVSYLELDFVDPERYDVAELPWQPSFPVIPSVPSTLTQAQDAAQRLLQRLEGVPVESILANVDGLLGDVRRQVNSGDAAQMLSNAAELVRNLNQALARADVGGLASDLRGVAADARGLVNGREIRDTLRAIAAAAESTRTAVAQLPQVVRSLEGTARTTRNTVGDVNADLAPILRDLRATASNLRDTTDLLRRAPSQAVLGAPPPVPDWARNR